MVGYGYDKSNGDNPPYRYLYDGPGLTVQRISKAVVSQGSILPVAASSVNSTWDLHFEGPSLHCKPVSSNFRCAVLDNILQYTYASENNSTLPNCDWGPGYVAWHPRMMTPNASMTQDLPFIVDNLNSSGGALNNVNRPSHGNSDMASIFLAIAPTQFSSRQDQNPRYYDPTLCLGKLWYQDGLEEYHNTSTMLRCDLHNSTYHTTFSFINGMQFVEINDVVNSHDRPLITIGEVLAFVDSPFTGNLSSQPHACPPMDECLFDTRVLSTLSYQAVMHAFSDLLTGMISLQDTMTISTTELSSTVLAEAPELAFLQSGQAQN